MSTINKKLIRHSISKKDLWEEKEELLFGMCSHDKPQASSPSARRRKFFSEGKRKLRGGTVVTIE